MAILDVLTIPNPILRERSKPVEVVDARIKKLVDDMFDTLYSRHGVGLAAPQVGVLERVIVVDAHIGEQDKKPDPHCMINPEITWSSKEEYTYMEGCFSVPEQFADVIRPAEIKVRYLNREGEQKEMDVSNCLLGVAIQHEIDHLDGKLFIDHLSRVKRDMLLRRLSKIKRLGG